eukprot:CAMPEP_0184694440 /NCGR_PEP_ID=MMETSP0313-20130426/2398_1 /TAXON_ID=2792 /ORGANISM="Porphyridium aerugineum, Strain SAG 1380-2" /LENGTH=445 /DNA_ID=CAMNT_0027152735 /DNA_START=12 /DNA_END=1349 /DNA_ORIENTATION=-
MELYNSKPSGPMNTNRDLLESLKSFQGSLGLYVYPNIPKAKLSNASTSCQVQQGDTILAVLDCTILGSAKNCLVVGVQGIYIHNDWWARQPGRFFVPYDELNDLDVSSTAFEIVIGKTYSVAVSGCPMPKREIVTLLRSVKNIANSSMQIRSPQPFSVKPSREDELLQTIRLFQGNPDLYIVPTIPESKLAKATESYKVSPDETVLALLNCSVFGSAKNGMIIGLNGIYYHNDAWERHPGTFFIPYTEFGKREFSSTAFEIVLGHGATLSVPGCNMPKKEIVNLLKSIQQVVSSFPSAYPISDIPIKTDPLVNFQEVLLGILKLFQGHPDVYIHPDIPKNKLNNARASYKIPTSETVICLINCAAFRSAKHGIAFGLQGIYYQNDWSGNQPGAHFIPYSEFKYCTIGEIPFEVTFGSNKQSLCVAGCQMRKTDIIHILNTVQTVV